VEHVVSGSHGDNVKPMARVCRGVAGPRCAESMLRERGANNRCRCGQPYAAAGRGCGGLALDGDMPTRGGASGSHCAHGSVFATGSQGRCGRGGCLATIRIGLTISARPWAQGLLLWNVRWSCVSFDGSWGGLGHACRGRPAANPIMLRRPIVSIKRIKETVELHRCYEF
jgi:hypothetical protein